MSIKCKLGFHNWDGCRCSDCEKIRNDQHDFIKDCEKCSKCGKTIMNQHDWTKDCEKCSKCSKTIMNQHDWTKDCEKCSKCGKTEDHHDYSDDCEVCIKCGNTKINQHDWVGCRCTKCRKIRDDQHDWSKDCEKCSKCNKTRDEVHEWKDGKCIKCLKINIEKGTFHDPRDGVSYKTIKIGDKTWLAENLRYKLSSECWICGNSQKNLDKYGYLYTWNSAKKAIPKGWHLPSKAEFEILTKYLGKDNGEVYDQIIDNGDSGFNVLWGGSKYMGNLYDDSTGHDAWFWSSTEESSDDAFYIAFGKESVGTFRNECLIVGSFPKNNAYSVRAIKDS